MGWLADNEDGEEDDEEVASCENVDDEEGALEDEEVDVEENVVDRGSEAAPAGKVTVNGGGGRLAVTEELAMEVNSGVTIRLGGDECGATVVVRNSEG